jgi:hypothetical protein
MLQNLLPVKRLILMAAPICHRRIIVSNNINPEKNPAILNTLTWDSEKIADEINKNKNEILKIGKHGTDEVKADSLIIKEIGILQDGRQVSLIKSANGQAAFMESSSGPIANDPQNPPFLSFSEEKKNVDIFECNYSSTAEYLRLLKDDKHSKALGYESRLGIGSRMTTFSWGPALEVINKSGISSNLIQNSVREVRVFDELEKGLPARDVYLYSFGTIKEGHTGSTFEGLWLSGTISAILANNAVPYGSDADHIKIDNLDTSLERAKSIIESCKNYSFFTIDTSGVVEFDAEKVDLDDHIINTGNKLSDIYHYHNTAAGRSVNSVSIDRSFVEAMLVKYENSLIAMEKLDSHLEEIKGKGNYDLEWSLDEIPAGVDVAANITSSDEIFFLLNEVKRREINLTHIAPNLGVEKGVDYRINGGREYLASLLGELCRISSEFGIMVDVHSGDNLSTETRKVINKASGGKIHYKISPVTQEIFAETLFEKSYEDFLFWWKEAFKYAQNQAEKGSTFAQKCLKTNEVSDGKPSPDDMVFHYYHYPPVGENYKDGNLYLREYLYSLNTDIYQAYSRKFAGYLDSITKELFISE